MGFRLGPARCRPHEAPSSRGPRQVLARFAGAGDAGPECGARTWFRPLLLKVLAGERELERRLGSRRRPSLRKGGEPLEVPPPPGRVLCRCGAPNSDSVVPG